MSSVRPLFALVTALSVVAGDVAADPIVGEDLVALITLDEGSGSASVDLTGNGHNAELVGTDWGQGFASVGSGGDRIMLSSHPDLRASSFTYDLWFEAGYTAGNGRILNQTGAVGGTGPDVLERSRHVAIRINDSGAVFDVPTIGTRSNSGPPDHWGTSEDLFTRVGGAEHLVITHDAGSKTVHMFLGGLGQPLKHTFSATYQGNYSVSNEALTLGNNSRGERPFAGNFYQLAYYSRALSFEVDNDRNVTGGEILSNHLAGADADLVPSGDPRAVAGDDRYVMVGESVVFDGSNSSDSDGSVVGYAWDFGDGSTATQAVATHAYQQSGLYSATLVVTDNDGNSDGDSVRVHVASSSDGIATSPSGHYLTYGGRPMLLAGDSGTQCVMQNANLDHRAWIDDGYDRGANAVHLWSFMAVRQRQDGGRIEDRWGYVLPDITPWARRSDGPNAVDQKPQWDLMTFDEGADEDLSHYWPKLRDLVAYAKARDMLVGITVFFGGGKDNWQEGWHPFYEVNGGPAGVDDDCEIVEIASPGVEVMTEAWSDSWPRAKQVQWLWERFSQKLIDETLDSGNVFYVFMDEHSYCSASQEGTGDHFRDFFRSRGAYWADWGARRSSVDMVYDQRLLHQDSDSTLEAHFFGTPHRPFIGLEEGSSGGFNYTSDLLYMVWKYLIEGGNYFHHNDARMESDTTGVMSYDSNATPAGRLDMVRQRMTWVGGAARFFNNVQNLDLMEPNDSLVSRGDCLANPGREYLVYLPSGGDFSIDLPAADQSYTVERFNCRTGESSVQETVAGGGAVAIGVPSGDHLAYHIFLPVPVPPDAGLPDAHRSDADNAAVDSGSQPDAGAGFDVVSADLTVGADTTDGWDVHSDDDASSPGDGGQDPADAGTGAEPPGCNCSGNAQVAAAPVGAGFCLLAVLWLVRRRRSR